MSKEYVCHACFGDIGLQQFVSENAVDNICSFCGRDDSEPIAAPIDEVANYIKRCLLSEYDDDAANCLPYESAEGGYTGITWDTYANIGLDQAILSKYIAKQSLFGHYLGLEGPFGVEKRNCKERPDGASQPSSYPWTSLAHYPSLP